MSFNDSNNPDKLKDYGELGYNDEYRKRIDESNSHKLMMAQYQEIIDQQKYRKESRKGNKRSFKLLIASLIIAFLTLVATIIGWFI